ncbi:hypothetical protein AAKU67_001892 [Oxalobacteraceae bacterium GrIS 2.11]
MISKRLQSRKDGKSSARDSFEYGAGLKVNKLTGASLDKCLRVRFGNFGLIENGVYPNLNLDQAKELIKLASLEMQSNCNLNGRVRESNKIAHFIFSFNQIRPTEAVLLDTENSMLRGLKLDENHFASFAHEDSGHFHIHVFVSRIQIGGVYRCNSLWQDRTIRDKICRELEIRHCLYRDNGLHTLNENGEIVEVPPEVRRERRNQNPQESGFARQLEIVRGEKSFQSWMIDVRVGDGLKLANSWSEIHSIAASLSIEIKPRGAGFVVCPVGQKGSMKLSTLGLKDLVKRFGPFVPPQQQSGQVVKNGYRAAPLKGSAGLYERYKTAAYQYRDLKKSLLTEFRSRSFQEKNLLKIQQKNEVQKIKIQAPILERKIAISLLKMSHTGSLIELRMHTALTRRKLLNDLNNASPGDNYREYLFRESKNGNLEAINVFREICELESTSVLITDEVKTLIATSSLSGPKKFQLSSIQIKHHIESNGTIVFDLGNGRSISDSTISNRILLNHEAQIDPDSIEIALAFAVSRFGPRLELTGSSEFQKLAVEIAFQRGIYVEFIDPRLDEYQRKLKGDYLKKEINHVSNLTKNTSGKNEATDPRSPLLYLSARNLVPGEKLPEVFLQADDNNDLGTLRDTKQHVVVRRPSAEGEDNGNRIGRKHSPGTRLGRSSVESSKRNGSEKSMSNATASSKSNARGTRRTAISNKPQRER